MQNTCLVDVEKVTKAFGTMKALNQLSLQLERARQYVVRGPSGSGKSTLLYLLAGLDRPTSGKIIIDQKNLTEMNDESLAAYRNQFVGLVFQFHFLLPTMTCLDNILLPASIGGHHPPGLRQKINDLAKTLGVDSCLPKFPYQLSGGEQQRVNIIRAVSLSPQLLLCDEPTGNLDSKNAEKVTLILRDLAQEFKATLVVVTHDDKVASHFPDSFHLEDGQLKP